MSEFYLRTESIKSSEIINLSVVNADDANLIKALKSPEPCLLEGSRGTGKSFLMKMAEIEIEEENSSALSVFVVFNKSSLINTEDRLQFYHWMLAKTLKALTNKLRKKGLSVSSYSSNLLSNDISDNNQTIENNLKNIVKIFEESYKNTAEMDISSLPDIEDVKEAIENICEENSLERIYIFFDEAAHVFRPEQQRQFFNLFKDLRSPYITCNAAIYPGITYFGDSFELTHDCTYRKIERNIKDSDYLQYFKDIVFKQADEALKEALRLLTYTGIINKLDSSIRATRSELGARYEVKYGCIISLETSPHADSKSFFESLSIKKHPEFGKHHPSYSGILDFSLVKDEDQYKASLKSMLEKSIDVLGLLTNWQKSKLKSASIYTIEDLHSNTETDLIENIYNVGPVRARLMKNAATAELLEYLSG